MNLKFYISKIYFLTFMLLTINFYAQHPNNQKFFIGDWASDSEEYYAQIYRTDDNILKLNIVKDLTSRGTPIAILSGVEKPDGFKFTAKEWSGKFEDSKLILTNDSEKLVFSKFYRSSPTMNKTPPDDAIILFDGKDLDAWKQVVEKDWLEGKGGAADKWKILPNGFLEVVPGTKSIITKQQFGDIKLHLEFRLLGEKTNGGVYFMSRYEINIKDAYGKFNEDPIGFGNIADPSNLYPDVNVAFPPLQWQTLDIDFKAPRFNAAGTKKIKDARITVYHNGVKIYDNVALKEVRGATARLGEAAIGPIYLQEHGAPYQFRNIWVVDKTISGTKNGHTSIQNGHKKNNGKEIKQNKNDQKNDSKNKKREKKGKNTYASYAAELNPLYADTTVNLRAQGNQPAEPAGFVHPGVLVNIEQLQEIRRRVEAGIEPQKSAFEKLKNSPYGALDYEPDPRHIVSCGPHSTPNLGCKDEQEDSAVAYSQALLWFITGNKKYAENAIKIMNAWSYTLTGGHNYGNGPVQAAWTGSIWPRAAEIIRYTYSGWSDRDIAQFQNMLRTQYLPSIIHGDCENGNKELAMAEALVNIGVFNDDREVFELGLKMWRGRTPAYIYLESDGEKPIQPPGCPPAYWSNKGLMPELVDGLLQETARDAHHHGMAFASMANAAETARQQGIGLYHEESERMRAALEFVAQYLPPNNTPIPENLEFTLLETWEIAYNHFHNRKGYDLPNMTKVILINRPTGVNHHIIWETLTHGEMGAVGLPPIKGREN